jgi:type IV secretory pathway VirB6-like protein
MASDVLTLTCSKLTVSADVIGAGTLIQTMLSEVTCASMALSSNLISEGHDLLAVLLLVMVTFHLLLALLGADWGSTMVDLFRLFIKAAVVTYLLNFWSSDVVNFFTTQFDKLADKASGGASGAGQALAMGWKAIEEIFGIGTAVDCVKPGATGDGPPCRDGNYGISDVFKLIGDLPSMLLKLIAAIYVVGMMVGYVVVMFTGVVVLGLGMAVGPILIPCLVFPPLENLFSNWLGFMITGGFYKIVGAIVVGIMTAMFSVLGLIASEVNASGAINIIAALLMIVIAMVGKEFMWAVPEYAASLGGVRLGRISGFHNARNFADKESGNVANNAASDLKSGLGRAMGGFGGGASNNKAAQAMNPSGGGRAGSIGYSPLRSK